VSDCEHVVGRLVEGAGGGREPAADPDVALHLGSCLDCFRTLTELRDVPKLAELLQREGADGDAARDPGPAFWDTLAARIADGVAEVDRPAPAEARAPAAAARPRRGRAPSRRGPALAGAFGVLAAAALALALVARNGAPPLQAPSEMRASAPVPGEVAGEDLAGDADVALSEGPTDVEALDGPGLERLLESLRTSEPMELRGLIDDGGEAGIADAIAGLDAAALRRLAQRLAGSTL
jgi:hypothetical protein